ncbi:GNAT family N-acetyltransferase [Shewanella algae]|uniref:GNAT family N-acetyltransferase n=1 Tax=Shewanella algae TaxID=38313 RepID=UPI00271FEB20|nr:N-acetyltransferase [Shewanella algae]MDO8254152.1 N-acetyltransferase [Shewanella algae]
MLTKEQVLEFLLEVDSEFSPPLSSKLDLELYAIKIVNNAIIISDIHNGNELRGMAATYANEERKHTAYLTFIGVKKCFRGLGIARSMINATEAQLLKAGFSILRLEVYKENRAIELYKDIGFEVYKESLDSYYMEKVIAKEMRSIGVE